jgi:hypothetical protein
LTVVPVIDFLFGLILLIAVALLDLAFELILLARYRVKIIVGQLAPLFLYLALDLLPVTSTRFQSILFSFNPPADMASVRIAGKTPASRQRSQNSDAIDPPCCGSGE